MVPGSARLARVQRTVPSPNSGVTDTVHRSEETIRFIIHPKNFFFKNDFTTVFLFC